MTALQDRQKELAGYLTVGFPKLALRAWALAGASACVGNFTQENLCRPVTEGQHDEGSDGMGQWRELRLTGDGDHGQPWGMRPWCIKYFGVWNTIEAQAAFTMFEVARDFPTLDAELRSDLTGVKPANVRSVLDYKTKMFMELYERPNAALAGLAYWQSQAAAIYAVMATGKAPAPTPAPAKSTTVPDVIVAGGGVVVGAGTAAGGLLLTANGDLTTLAAVVISVVLLTIVIGIPLILRKPTKAAPAISALAKLAAALERRAIANAEVAEAAEELKESLQQSTDLLIAAGITHQAQRSYQPQ
jgi:hypothetical protein